MAIGLSRWHKLNPSFIGAVPDEPGVFEIANLVRTVLYVGRAEGNLRQRLASLGTVPTNLPASVGGYYVRYCRHADEEAALAEAQTSYRESHAGHLPAGNESLPRPTIRLIARNAA